MAKAERVAELMQGHVVQILRRVTLVRRRNSDDTMMLPHLLAPQIAYPANTTPPACGT